MSRWFRGPLWRGVPARIDRFDAARTVFGSGLHGAPWGSGQGERSQTSVDVLRLRTPMNTLFLGPPNGRGLASLRPLTGLGRPYEPSADCGPCGAWIGGRDPSQMNALRTFLGRAILSPERPAR